MFHFIKNQIKCLVPTCIFFIVLLSLNFISSSISFGLHPFDFFLTMFKTNREFFNLLKNPSDPKNYLFLRDEILLDISSTNVSQNKILHL